MPRDIKLLLDSKVYPLETIVNACYGFIERAYIFLDIDSKRKKTIVFLKTKLKTPVEIPEEHYSSRSICGLSSGFHLLLH